MKFVTVMDMWLLIINIVLLGFIAYYGKRVIKMMARITNKMDQDAIVAERRRIIKMLEVERESYAQAASLSEDGKDFHHVVDTLDDVIDRVSKGK
jgi:hypothetical protein